MPPSAHSLIISSLVAYGHVGISAMSPLLMAMGQRVTSLPTVILSHHPRHASSKRSLCDPYDLANMFDGLKQDGLLSSVDTIVTGYLPTPDHVAFACNVIDTIRLEKPHVRVVCDPILGDDPNGLYIDLSAAMAIKTSLIAKADIITPNRFEFSWLTDQDIVDITSAKGEADALNVDMVIATSIPSAKNQNTLANILVLPNDYQIVETERYDNAPSGTGDVLAGLFIGHLNAGRTPQSALKHAVSGVQLAISVSGSAKDLSLTPHLEKIVLG